MSKVEQFEEVQVDRHIKLKSKAGQIDAHASDSICGAWIGKGKKQIGVVSERDMVYICLWGDKGKDKFPVALTPAGIQIPTADGKPEFFEWSRLAEVLRK